MRAKGTGKAMQKTIDKMVDRIVRHFDPEQVILFGSRARGDARPDSAVDLLVVMPFTGSRSEKQIDIRMELRDIPVAKDIVVTTPEDFAWRRLQAGTIERPASAEGRTMYVRA